MEVTKIDNMQIDVNAKVRIKEMGNITEIMYSNSYASTCSIKKLNKYEYLDLETGEVKEFKKMENRACDISSVRKSLGRLRDYINTNVTDVNNCKWVTLTYAENMTDPKKLYDDFKKFNMRLKYFLKVNYEYIVAMEPQGRGAWHAHMLLIFDNKAPWIANDDMFRIWKNGWTTTKKLDDVDNVGAYLTSYMCDVLVDDVKDMLEESPELLRKLIDGSLMGKEVQVDERGVIVTKTVVKGARLYLYPPQFNLYRCSKGIEKPVIFYDTEKNAQKKVGSAKPTYEKSIQLEDVEKDFKKVLNYRYYNSLRH